MHKRYYIAYGSNLNVRQMCMRCPTAKIVGTGVIKDYELLFKGSMTGSYLTIEKRKGGIVPIALWSVGEYDEQRLDAYEGFPSFYYKKELTVAVRGIISGKVMERDSFVYIMHEDRKPGTPSDRYFSTCCEGYDYFGFDKRHLVNAYMRSEEKGK